MASIAATANAAVTARVGWNSRRAGNRLNQRVLLCMGTPYHAGEKSKSHRGFGERDAIFSHEAHGKSRYKRHILRIRPLHTFTAADLTPSIYA